MRTVTASGERLTKDIHVRGFGYENNSSLAHWGRGCRDVFILHYVLTGEGVFNGKCVSCGEGFFIKPGQMHEYHSSKKSPWTYFWVIFDGECAELIYQKHITKSTSDIFQYGDSNRLLSIIDKIFSESAEISEAMALSYFWLLMSLSKKSVFTSENRYISEAKRYMELHFSSPITIAEIAASIRINDRYLYNLFINHEGCAPKKYLTRIRMNRAKELLLESDISITEIAVSVGFSDVLTFSRFFSKNAGQSPSEYRRSVRLNAKQYR